MARNWLGHHENWEHTGLWRTESPGRLDLACHHAPRRTHCFDLDYVQYCPYVEGVSHELCGVPDVEHINLAAQIDARIQ